MNLDLLILQNRFPDLQSTPLSREKGATAYQLRLPEFQEGRGFEWAELRLPKGFPDHAKAFIQLSSDAVLRVPHVDKTGVLCTREDPGPCLGYSIEDRILILLHGYQEEFLKPWLAGSLDNHFEDEALNYWAIEVARTRSNSDPVRSIWTLDSSPSTAKVRTGLLLLPNRVIIAADEDLNITNRVVQSMGHWAQQRIRVLIADVPINYPFTPNTWPTNARDLERILRGRLTPEQYHNFQFCRSRRGRRIHRVLLLRNRDFAFAYLLPEGPATVLELGSQKKTFPPLNKPLPLNVTRLDPNWTVGRDQHTEVSERQCKHILILGAGALGSPIIDHLAKAGLGRVSVVDPDSISSANIGRHFLGAESIGQKKAVAVAQRVNGGYPATLVIPHYMTAEEWFRNHSLDGIDAVLDLTGEPDVRAQVELARKVNPCPLLIGWMEPYVAAAHACILPAGYSWFYKNKDMLKELEAVEWPEGVIQREPGCSSLFQSYTAAAAEHAVALIAENALEIIDSASELNSPIVLSWVRGQRYLDKHWPGLTLRDWAMTASSHDGMILTRSFHE